MLTVHMIGNAHLDPVWLWHKADAVDACLATCRSACDRLDEFPQFVNTASTVWFHDTVRRLDPGLWRRVREHVGAGRWQPVGPMLVQPDCNLPSAESVAAHYRLGRAWFGDHLGVDVTVGYNVDSFGHGAYVPRIMQDAGVDSYVFMRPSPAARALPGLAFTWRSPDGGAVTAFRMPVPYTTRVVDIREHVQATIDATDPGHGHVMCFFGVGDHGGGPTAEQIRWIIDHAESFDGARLAFSHPRAYFDAVAAAGYDLPAFEGEIQHHAVGCYSVERRIKVSMVRAERALVRAEAVTDILADHAPANAAERLEAARRAVLFNQFHDILCGTSVDRASAIAAGEMVAAESVARDVLTETTRRAVRNEAVPGEHRIHIMNASDRPFEGLVEHEPWIDYRPVERIELQTLDGSPVAAQQIAPAARIGFCRRVLFPVALPPRSSTNLKCIFHASADDAPTIPAVHGAPKAEPGHLSSDALAASVRMQAIVAEDWSAALVLRDDPTNTWGNEAGDRFEGRELGTLSWDGPAEVVETGPLRAGLATTGRMDESRLWCRTTLGAGEPFVHLRLRVHWAQMRQQLVLRVSGPAPIESRTDLVSGGPLRRAVDGCEYPLAGALRVGTAGRSFALVAPEVFSAAVTPEAISLTLIRSPLAAHQGPCDEPQPDHPVTDRGDHVFDILLWPGFQGSDADLAAAVDALAEPPLTWDLTG